jgi:hypothetical protein
MRALAPSPMYTRARGAASRSRRSAAGGSSGRSSAIAAGASDAAWVASASTSRPAGERRDPQPSGGARDDVDGLAADRAGRAEQGETARGGRCHHGTWNTTSFSQ